MINSIGNLSIKLKLLLTFIFLCVMPLIFAGVLLMLPKITEFEKNTRDSSVEYQIKAGYLYNFTKFITWPADNAETFNLCILGDDPFGERIDPIEKKSAMGRPIKLFRFNSLGSMDKEPHCHILFVSSSIKESLVAQDFVNTLVVGEGEEFLEQGGMISFVINKLGKIKLRSNKKTIDKSSLKVGGKFWEVLDKGNNND